MAVSRMISNISFFLFLSFTVLCFSSCGLIKDYFYVVKRYPDKKPFIYETNVHVRGELKDVNRKDLELQLANQLHDSVKVRTVSNAAGWLRGPRVFYSVLEKPIVFDSLNAEKSKGFMRDYLNSLGYFRDSISYSVKIDTSKGGNKLETTLDFNVYPNIVTRLDSIAYRLNADTAFATAREKRNLDTIQQVTMDNLSGSVVKKGDPFSKYKLSTERDRLADVYRNNGYLRFSEEELLVLWDTVGIDLLAPTVDPIEQARLLQRLAERRANPVADVEFRLRENPDSTRITRYYVGKVSVYPEFTGDTTEFNSVDTIENYLIRHNEGLFKKKIFPDYIFLNPGELYRQSNLLKTQNKFNALSAWRLVSIRQKPREGQDTADFDIRLTPARKYAFNANFEVSRHQASIALTQGNLIGFAFAAGVQNRNFRRGANQSSFNFRYGTELNASIDDLIQSRQVVLGYHLRMPRLVLPSILKKKIAKSKENTYASIFSLNTGLTDRKDYFNLASFNASWGYQVNWENKLLNIRFPNIEYNYLRRGDSLEVLIQKNASYAYIFNTGVIVSLPASITIAGGKENISRLFSFSFEIAGVPGLLRNAFNSTLYRFVRADLEYRQTHKLGLDAVAWRFFWGAGRGLPFSSSDLSNQFLPFFRQYYGGGPNSMRAWSIREIGPGSAVESFDDTENPDRFGDIRLEGNLEYRKHLFNYGTIAVQTALYTDIGNVWFLRDNPDFPNGEFPTSFSKFWKDIGIGVGTGLRVDLSTFLKIRLDYAYKLKNPTPDKLEAQNKWAYGWQLFNGQLQLGIDYPF